MSWFIEVAVQGGGGGGGPAWYVLTAGDMQPGHDGNVIIKYADYSHLIVPAVNSDTSIRELRRIKDWADDNNLQLNVNKSREIIFQARGLCNNMVQLPPPCMGIEQVTQITALGVVINDHMTATDHVTALLTSCTKLLYALRMLR